MSKVSILILESNTDFLNQLKEYFGRNEKFELVGASDDGSEGIGLIQKFSPDAVLLGLVLKGIDGIGVLEKIKEGNFNCVSVVMGAFSDDSIINRVMSKGASYYIVKPFSPEVAEKRIIESVEANVEGRSNIPAIRRKAIDEEISTIFISIGIPPHIKGYSYLREGIKMTVSKPSIINNVTKELYPKIGEKFDTSASKVERAIRHAIEVAWNRGRIDAINSVFGARVYIGTEKPTNSEFIALVADKLILENML